MYIVKSQTIWPNGFLADILGGKCEYFPCNGVLFFTVVYDRKTVMCEATLRILNISLATGFK